MHYRGRSSQSASDARERFTQTVAPAQRFGTFDALNGLTAPVERRQALLALKRAKRGARSVGSIAGIDLVTFLILRDHRDRGPSLAQDDEAVDCAYALAFGPHEKRIDLGLDQPFSERRSHRGHT